MQRRMIRYSAILFAIFNTFIIYGQTVRGILIQENTSSAASNVPLFLEDQSVHSISDPSGGFELFPVSMGEHNILGIINGDTVLITTVTVNHELVNLGSIVVKGYTSGSLPGELAIIDFAEISGFESENDNFSGLLSASQDPISNAAAYNLSFARFRIRGYFNEDTDLMLNGMPMNDLDDGRVLWNAWGGLNDVFRAQTDIPNLQANEFGFGGVGGLRIIDLRASDQRKQKKAVYTFSNRTYQHRVMYTQSSGMQQNGWAYSISGSLRYGSSGYIPGTNMSAGSYFVSVDKKLGERHLLNVLFFGAPTRRGRSTGAVKEVYDLTGNHYYNPNWGYQNGKARNSREYITNQPVAMLRHDFAINKKTKVSTTLGYQFGKFGSTRLDWYDAPDPRPDYYRKLPSYFKDDEAYAAGIAERFLADENVRQINWDQLYDANRGRFYSIANANSIEGNTVSGKLAAYILEQEHFDNEKRSLNSVLTFVANPKFTLNGGIQYLNDITHNYRQIEDLMGADFYIDWDKFSSTAFPDNPDAIQNDLNRPNRIVKEGDILGHDYDINLTRIQSWAQGLFSTKKIDYFLAGQLSHTSFFREGYMKNGRFPENSFGKGDVHTFLNFGVKGGITYKIDGNNYITARSSYRTRAPFSRQVYVAPRTRDGVVDNLRSENIFASDLSYELRFPRLKGRISVYYTTYENQITNDVFYHDDLRTFVNYSTTGINKTHAGVEMGIDYKINTMITLSLMGNLAEYFYTSRPRVTITRDNTAEVLADNREVFLNNYFVGGIPQKAGVIGLDFQLKDFWRFNVDLNAFADTYIDVNPDRRTSEAVDGVDPVENSALFQEIINQEKLPGGFTIDVGVYKSWKMFDDHFLRFNANVSNVLNNTNIISGGFEQLRFDFAEKDVNRFPSRYFYAFGTNYTISLSYLF